MKLEAEAKMTLQKELLSLSACAKEWPLSGDLALAALRKELPFGNGLRLTNKPNKSFLPSCVFMRKMH